MDLGLRDTVALVTGASSGIGAATAQLLADEGADVVIAYNRNPDGAAATLELVRATGRRGWLLGFDLRNPGEVRSAVQTICAEVGKLATVVLCAGQNIVTPLAELTTDEWDEILAINLHGPFYLLQAVTPYLHPGGAIVTVASVAGQTGAPHHAHYAAAKAGLINLTKSAARALAPNIRVNCVAPGVTLTAMGADTAANLAPDYAQTKLLSGRFAEPMEIARAIVFLASPKVGFITGATLDINGGRELR